ncbi:uncharacterized protein LOC100383783 [Zea mays]|uniref:Uncharacterized protein n=1 Tax=Zea mays TaxID=4577 RepID=C0PJ02_MAIZE|nr:uncharacterized protein LOC100383783 [Zea mays]ACN35168.1 unknown [Zea mays]|eukprot:NP_001169889.1 uncharacterized protein LOC100383783 [Zea mays]
MWSVFLLPSLTPTRPSNDSATSSETFASVGRARVPTWHSACTLTPRNLTSTVGIWMLARSMRGRSFLRKRSLSSSVTRNTRSTKAWRCASPIARTSTSSCVCRRLRPRSLALPPSEASAGRTRPVRRRSKDGSRSIMTHCSASSLSTSSAPLRHRDDAPEKYGGGVGARHAVQASAQRLHACCATSGPPGWPCSRA